jgi:hypothetical protein
VLDRQFCGALDAISESKALLSVKAKALNALSESNALVSLNTLSESKALLSGCCGGSSGREAARRWW